MTVAATLLREELLTLRRITLRCLTVVATPTSARRKQSEDEEGG
jgi:hypothetical protein